jgi:hypothetical protein
VHTITQLVRNLLITYVPQNRFCSGTRIVVARASQNISKTVVDSLRGVHQEGVHQGTKHPDGPLNILAGPGVPSIPELASWGSSA